MLRDLGAMDLLALLISLQLEEAGRHARRGSVEGGKQEGAGKQ